jgi:hypothetical protein
MAKEFAMKRKRFSVEQIVAVLKQAELSYRTLPKTQLQLPILTSSVQGESAMG